MLTWREHPLLTPPTEEEMLLLEAKQLADLHLAYHESIENAQKDPYRYGFQLPHWGRAEEALQDVDEILALGGNRSGKTAWGAFCVVRAAIENPNSEIFCFAQTAEVSVRQQQAAVWEWLPPELKKGVKSKGAYISYTKKNGFTDSSFILDNGSQVIFKTYSQFSNNSTILEGAELGSHDPKWLNIGCWLDEYLLGSELISTIRFRLATRNAKLLVTFTPIDGWTEVIKDYLHDATTLEQRPAELLGGELVPYVQRSKKRNASIHYFHSEDNPFGGYSRIKSDLITAGREEILIRAYGVPVKAAASKFPLFSRETNVVKPSKVPRRGVTRYQIIDPAGRKNWWMVWIAVKGDGTWYVYREWPTIEIGDWAEQGGDGKWRPGPGAKGMGYGLRDYLDLIEQLEEGEEIFERIIDPRLGAQKYQREDGDSSIIEDLDELDFVVKPAPGGHIEDGLQKIIDLMSYNSKIPIDGANRPKFFISDECENTIKSLGEYTGDGGKDEAWKDPVDGLRYGAVAEIDHLEVDDEPQLTAVGGY